MDWDWNRALGVDVSDPHVRGSTADDTDTHIDAHPACSGDLASPEADIHALAAHVNPNSIAYSRRNPYADLNSDPDVNADTTADWNTNINLDSDIHTELDTNGDLDTDISTKFDTDDDLDSNIGTHTATHHNRQR